MHILIIKLGATGDVVRTTPLLRRFSGDVTWITASKNAALLHGLQREVRCLSWEQRHLAAGTDYDLLINLEDDRDSSLFAQSLRARRRFGAYLDSRDVLQYTADARRWFDMSLISTFGREHADILKLH